MQGEELRPRMSARLPALYYLPAFATFSLEIDVFSGKFCIFADGFRTRAVSD